MADDRTLWQADASDEARFRYEVIRNLSESVREIAASMKDVQTTQINMLERLARIEANRVNEDVAKLEERMNAAFSKIDKLERDKDQRDGAQGAMRWILTYGPVIFSAIAALWLVGRSLGVVPTPPVSTPTVQSSAQAEQRKDGK